LAALEERGALMSSGLQVRLNPAEGIEVIASHEQSVVELGAVVPHEFVSVHLPRSQLSRTRVVLVAAC
jgi:hypothetical protein